MISLEMAKSMHGKSVSKWNNRYFSTQHLILSSRETVCMLHNAMTSTKQMMQTNPYKEGNMRQKENFNFYSK
jgi:hypothetical protein